MKKDEAIRQFGENFIETLEHVMRAYKCVEKGLW